jgi:hypothetical protein
MKLFCPHCGVKGVADDLYRGKLVKCPKCLGTFVAIEPEKTVAGQEFEQPPAVPAGQPAIDKQAAETPIAEGPAEAEAKSIEEDVVGEEPAVELPAAAVEEGPETDTGWRETPIEAEALTEEELPVAPAVEETGAETAGEGAEVAADGEHGAAAPAQGEKDAPEPVHDWGEIPADIEAKAAEAEQELPAGIVAEAGKEEGGQPLPEVEPSPDPEPEQAAQEPQPATAGQEDAAAVEVPARAEDSGEGHFIFEERQPVQEVEDTPYGLIKEQCWQCGKKNRTGQPFTERSGRLFCPACAPAEPETVSEPGPAAAGFAGGIPTAAAKEAPSPDFMAEARPEFGIGGALREAWAKTKGAKGSIWAGSAVMYIAILALAAAGSFLLPILGLDIVAQKQGLKEQLSGYLFEVLINIITVMFSGGLILMGVRKVQGEPLSWKMIFAGFPHAGKLIIAWVLQSIFILFGFMVLVLPGIYLAIGYSMTIPLIVDRKMSPWQAMETSRKAIHKVWWRVAGLYFLMGLLFLVSTVPLGLGVIWTWPMFVVLAGVVYHFLFGRGK